jgi:hypothetical protein
MKMTGHRLGLFAAAGIRPRERKSALSRLLARVTSFRSIT